ncbi:hypothetical protein QQZ08_011864, partial [Neonectria magnoliae]
MRPFHFNKGSAFQSSGLGVYPPVCMPSDLYRSIIFCTTKPKAKGEPDDADTRPMARRSPSGKQQARQTASELTTPQDPARIRKRVLVAKSSPARTMSQAVLTDRAKGSEYAPDTRRMDGLTSRHSCTGSLRIHAPSTKYGVHRTSYTVRQVKSRRSRWIQGVDFRPGMLVLPQTARPIGTLDEERTAGCHHNRAVELSLWGEGEPGSGKVRDLRGAT